MFLLVFLLTSEEKQTNFPKLLAETRWLEATGKHAAITFYFEISFVSQLFFVFNLCCFLYTWGLGLVGCVVALQICGQLHPKFHKNTMVTTHTLWKVSRFAQRNRRTCGSNVKPKTKSRKIWSVEELETLPAGTTKPRTSHHRSPGGERSRKRKPLNDLPWEDRERAIGSIRPRLELFQGKLWGNSWETEWMERIWAFPNA